MGRVIELDQGDGSRPVDFDLLVCLLMKTEGLDHTEASRVARLECWKWQMTPRHAGGKQ